MVKIALEYVRVCEAESFDQIVFNIKTSNPRVVVEAYRLLAARLEIKVEDPAYLDRNVPGDLRQVCSTI